MCSSAWDCTMSVSDLSYRPPPNYEARNGQTNPCWSVIALIHVGDWSKLAIMAFSQQHGGNSRLSNGQEYGPYKNGMKNSNCTTLQGTRLKPLSDSLSQEGVHCTYRVHTTLHNKVQ